jgi:hypothetical protein
MLSAGSQNLIWSLPMPGYIVLSIVTVGALFILALIALLRGRPEDIPSIVNALARWWK